MKTKTEIANAIAEQNVAWFRSKIRDAYNQGWKDCQEQMLEKAEALVRVARGGSDGANDDF